jgi:hypothetical protein
MPDSRKLLSGKRKYLFGLILISLIPVISVAFSMTGSDDFDIARREILLRRIGHELLLQSGDSTSRVLPVKKIAENEYQITFEQELTFQADSLVNTTQRLLAKDPLAGDYIVNVLNCGTSSIAYGLHAKEENSPKHAIRSILNIKRRASTPRKTDICWAVCHF